ncbi:hypothetical protein WI845_08085 [Vibrio cholerae]
MRPADVPVERCLVASPPVNQLPLTKNGWILRYDMPGLLIGTRPEMTHRSPLKKLNVNLAMEERGETGRFAMNQSVMLGTVRHKYGTAAKSERSPARP